MKANSKAFHRTCSALFAVLFCRHLHDVQAAPPADGGGRVDQATLDRWAASYRNWHYWPEHVIPARPGSGLRVGVG